MTSILDHPTLSSGNVELLADFAYEVYNDKKNYKVEIPGWQIITPELVNYGLDQRFIIGDFFDSSDESGDASAVVAKNGNTLLLAFRGTDSNNDRLYWFNIGGHFSLFDPLFDAFEDYTQNNSFSQLWVTGHSLGGAMVEYFMEEYNQYPNFNSVSAVSFASPSASKNDDDTRVLNIGHENDIVYSIIGSRNQNANSTMGIYTIIGDEHGSGFNKEHDMGKEHRHTVKTIFNSAYYDRMTRDSVVIIDRTDETSEISFRLEYLNLNPLSSTDVFILGEDDDDDNIFSTGGDDVLEGFGGNDTLKGDELSVIFYGDDTLDGGKGDDNLDGGKGDDNLDGGEDADSLFGGDGKDTAIFSDEFQNYDYSFNQDTETITFSHIQGTQIDGTDTLQEIEFAQFSDVTRPLPLEYGPESTEIVDIFDENNQVIGKLSLELPTYSFVKEVPYTISLSSNQQGIQYNFAYIIDVSGSMSGSPLTQAKNAYSSLTNFLIADGIADISQFVVIPFETYAQLQGPFDAENAKTTINGLFANGGTNFEAPLQRALAFFGSLSGGATNIVYFLSDGQGSGYYNDEATELQKIADVRAFGIGGANLSTLNIIDSGDAVLLSDPAQLQTEFQKSGFSKDDITEIKIFLDTDPNDTIASIQVDTISPDKLEDSALGLNVKGKISGLNTGVNAQNKITAEVLFNNGAPNSIVNFIVNTDQGRGSPTAQNDRLNFAPIQKEMDAGAGDDEIVANELANIIYAGDGNDIVSASGGNDIIYPGSGDNRIDGGEGIDTVVYTETLAQRGPVNKIGGLVKVGTGTDTLSNVEFIQFADTRISTPTLLPTPILSGQNISVNESNADNVTTIEFTVNLSSVGGEDVTFSYQTIDGSATAGFDYNFASREITIPAGDTSATIAVEIIGDDEFEFNEDFGLTLSQLSGASFDVNGDELTLFGVIENDDNTQPTDIFLSNETISENLPVEIVLGQFFTIDSDGDTQFTYTFVNGEGDTDNGIFTINANELLSTQSFDFETKNSYSIRVQTNDGNGGTFEKVFTINVSDMSEQPVTEPPQPPLDGGRVVVYASSFSDDQIIVPPNPDTASKFIGDSRDNIFEPSTASDLFDLTSGGANAIQGTLAQLNSDIIAGFDRNDKITIHGSVFSADQLQVTFGSSILRIDGNNDGNVDATITLEGDFSDALFLINQGENSTDISYDIFNTPMSRFQNKDIPGTYLFAGEEESQSIRDNYPNFIEEGLAFKVAEEGDNLIRMNRFQNKDIPGTYLFAGEEESQSIRENYPNFIEEGVAFYAASPGSSTGESIYRFQSLLNFGTYIFVGEEERQSIIDNYSNAFVEEGLAFELVA